MSAHVEHGPREVLVLVVTCPRCGLDAGTLDPHDARPLAVALAAMEAGHVCPPPTRIPAEAMRCGDCGRFVTDLVPVYVGGAFPGVDRYACPRCAGEHRP